MKWWHENDIGMKGWREADRGMKKQQEAERDIKDWMEADIGIEEWQKADKGIIYPKLTPNTISIYNLRESVDFQYCPPWEGNI